MLNVFRRFKGGSARIYWFAASRILPTLSAQAVADNQPANKNRMTPELSTFAARLRERLQHEPPRAGFDEEDFNTTALELFAFQFKSNLAYRKICEARRVTPLAVTHWSQIPAVPTAAFKELELTCLSPTERTHVFHSSGTTEQRPSRHFHSEESLAVYEASLWTWFVRNLRLALGDLRLLSLTPSPVEAPHSSLVHMFEVVRGGMGGDEDAFVGRVSNDGSWALDYESAVDRLTGDSRPETPDPRPILVLGTAFSFVHLLDGLMERNLRLQLPVGSRVMETGGYKGRSREMPKAELHALITERLGVPAAQIVCEYGMSELSSQAYQRVTGDEGQVTGDMRAKSCHLSPATCHFKFPPWARVQVVSPETGREVADGETGLIRVFDLANVFSVMAIQTEDLAVRRGDGFELVGRSKLAEPRGCSLMAV